MLILLLLELLCLSSLGHREPGQQFLDLCRNQHQGRLTRKLQEDPGPELLNCGTVDILCGVSLFVGGCPVHCRMFNGIPGHHPRDASRTHLPPSPPLCCDHQSCLRIFSNGRGAKLLPAESCCPREMSLAASLMIRGCWAQIKAGRGGFLASGQAEPPHLPT